MKHLFGLRGHDIADSFEQMCVKANEKGIKKLQFALAKTVSDVDFYEDSVKAISELIDL